MQVRIVYFEGCPNHEPAVSLVRTVAREAGVPVEVDEIKVETPEDARRERMLGSPTIQVDGIDVEPEARDRDDFAFTCRVYGGQDGLPSRGMVEAALTGSVQTGGSCDAVTRMCDDQPGNRGCC